MTPAQKARKKAENAWSQAIRTGCVRKASPEASQLIKTFMEKTLADDYTNIDHLGTVRTKKQDIANCGSGRYVVTSLKLPTMKVRMYGGTCAVVVGRDEMHAKFDGENVGGKFIWTDTWVKVGKEWKCVASHGSKL